MTDFASEFKKIFNNGCAPMTDWNQPRYFDALNNDCYAAEVALKSSLESEAYNKFGIGCVYFVKEFDTKFDPLFGEDQLENIKRRFSLQMYAQNIPNLQKQYQLQGMIYTEIIQVYCNIQHFAEASRYDWKTENPTAYESIVPKIGDLIYFTYSDLYYEVLNVKEFADGTSFLGKPITYLFHLRVWRNSHENVDEMNSNDDNMEHLRSYVELGETFNVDNDLGKHAPSATIVSKDNPNHSKVAASGDILSINKTTDWRTLRKSNNADAMDVLYDPNKVFEPFDAIQTELDNLDVDYSDTFRKMEMQTEQVKEEAIQLQDKTDELLAKTQENVTELKGKTQEMDTEIQGLYDDLETIQYTPKR